MKICPRVDRPKVKIGLQRNVAMKSPFEILDQGLVLFLDGFLKHGVGRVDAVPLDLHVPPELVEQRPEQDDAVAQRRLQLADRLKRVMPVILNQFFKYSLLKKQAWANKP